jgi:hypothetical protein
LQGSVGRSCSILNPGLQGSSSEDKTMTSGEFCHKESKRHGSNCTLSSPSSWLTLISLGHLEGSSPPLAAKQAAKQSGEDSPVGQTKRQHNPRTGCMPTLRGHRLAHSVDPPPAQEMPLLVRWQRKPPRGLRLRANEANQQSHRTTASSSLAPHRPICRAATARNTWASLPIKAWEYPTIVPNGLLLHPRSECCCPEHRCSGHRFSGSDEADQNLAEPQAPHFCESSVPMLEKPWAA